MSWSIQNPIQNLSNTGVLPDNGTFDLSSVQHNMHFGDDYDDLSELVEMPGAASAFSSLPGSPLSVEKTIRRRSSKGVVFDEEEQDESDNEELEIRDDLCDEGAEQPEDAPQVPGDIGEEELVITGGSSTRAREKQKLTRISSLLMLPPPSG